MIHRPGMGLNAYFAYTIVGYHGTGLISYNLALTAVFVEGFIFIFLSLIGMRQWLVKIIPVSLKVASACGIGLFLSEIGLSYNAGIGAITGATSTPLEIAGCPLEFRDDNGFCTSHKMTSHTASQTCYYKLSTLCYGCTNQTADVDWYLLRGHLHGLLDGFQSQVRYDRWHRVGLHSLMAVSTSVYYQF